MLVYCDDISLMTDEQYDLFFSSMPKERQEKTMRYVKAEDRALSVAAFALLCYALSLTDCKIGEYELMKKENGKPYFKNAPIHFNLSHTFGVVACAVSKSEIGVDIQKKVTEYSKVMRRVCCENEIEFITASKNPSDDFTRLWTLKESYVKCLGTGISDNMSRYDFSTVAQTGFGELQGCNFSVFDVGGSILSVCSSSVFRDAKRISLAELEYFFKKVQ